MLVVNQTRNEKCVASHPAGRFVDLRFSESPEQRTAKSGHRESGKVGDNLVLERQVRHIDRRFQVIPAEPFREPRL